MNSVELALAFASKEVLGKLLGKTADELGESFAVLTLPIRVRCEHYVLKNVQEYARRHGLKLKPLPLKLLTPALEAASLEEDPSLQELWARLIANASAGRASTSVVIFASSFLRSISYIEAVTIERMIETMMRLHDSNYRDLSDAALSTTETEFHHRTIPSSQLNRDGFEEEDLQLALDNLERLGITRLQNRRNFDGKPLESAWGFTRLGWAAVQLIRSPETRL